ncbi:archaetidylserine decarboxylase [Aggregatibacter actinomycetemcomitans]|uniref:archaetidylserine decarboxylase n=1 Tax=Aggregatibacter actinomycetemcomitans TaxID=714 RepID=UPI00022AC829|nr:archaetidylserine decarboxylase [Aggregatibacter actinomycetemcomitans]AEW76373.1 phosphatidylserine decarboxylase [Aggregatibacter actinomycetemcomitans ANH9381]AHN70904.1 phosphatidylserine decarboxylase, putative [Aggregatibacter actinomycetemcomitans HK1651]AMQ92437.1 phosphatidylserine decarboxylase [Aggregatibacter actinomycetemcomitans]KND84448.1 phosphatidylserine decarboxylase [Aggregatibacter actinomycetemcomitans serotype b str. SCC1398]KOE52443.1 phosphatidylserine decarboxylase
MNKSTYWQRLKVAFQYVMPQLYLTQLAGWFAKQKWGAVTHFVIKLFAKKYNVDMSEAKKENFSDYENFNQFFIRELKDGARKINENPTALCLPADGRVSQIGHIDDELLLQAKGHFFSLSDLLAGDEELVNTFKNGEFATIYLSPRDYHRVHMPCDATLRKMIYVPGALFSVNPFLAEHVSNLFARNERVICLFDTEFGPMVQILVGATITASMSTVWAGVINPPRADEVKVWTYQEENAVKLTKGQEMGAFQLGSTVINLFPANRVTLTEHLQVDEPVRVGEILATIN